MAVLLIKTVVLALVRIEMLLLLVRAVMSWFVRDVSPLYELIVSLTEPVIYPIRLISDRFLSKSALPIDISFIVTYLILYVIELLLSYL